MSQWNMDTPPSWAPNAVATSAGWTDPKTGEVLVAIKDLDKRTTKKQVAEQPKTVTPKKVATAKVEEAPAAPAAQEEKPAE